MAMAMTVAATARTTRIQIQNTAKFGSSRRHASISMALCVVTKGRNEQLETIGPDDDDDSDADAQRSAARLYALQSTVDSKSLSWKAFG